MAHQIVIINFKVAGCAEDNEVLMPGLLEVDRADSLSSCLSSEPLLCSSAGLSSARCRHALVWRRRLNNEYPEASVSLFLFLCLQLNPGQQS